MSWKQKRLPNLALWVSSQAASSQVKTLVNCTSRILKGHYLKRRMIVMVRNMVFDRSYSCDHELQLDFMFAEVPDAGNPSCCGFSGIFPSSYLLSFQ